MLNIENRSDELTDRLTDGWRKTFGAIVDSKRTRLRQYSYWILKLYDILSQISTPRQIYLLLQFC